jgi:hypothetical protein
MAGTVTETKLFGGGSRSQDSYINRIVLAWVSDASGVVSGTPTGIINGTICKVQFIPGSPAPSDAYDVTLTDTAGIDVLGGQGANQSATVAAAVIPGVPLKDGTTISVAPCVVADPLTLIIANAGNAKQGSVVLYIR